MIQLKTIITCVTPERALCTPVKWVSDLTEQVLDHFRHFRHFFSRHLSQSGMAYMAILILLAILSTLTFSFLFKVGTQTSATMTRGNSMQAHYLAESAANHAMWRLLNESDFPASETTYYMHSLASGRYGYKVRRHTDTTFATVATVGAIGENVVQQSYVLYVIPEKMYWADKDAKKIQRADLDGSNVEDLVTGVVDPKALVLDASGG